MCFNNYAKLSLISSLEFELLNVLAIIPARYASTRFEGKVIVDVVGKPMIQHVYERSIRAEKLSQVIVATDDQRIYDVVEGFGGQVVMTPEAETGSDRIAMVVKDMNCEVVVNVQGDEPLIEPEMINQLVQPFFDDSSVEVSTLKQKIDNRSECCKGCHRVEWIGTLLFPVISAWWVRKPSSREWPAISTSWPVCL